MGKKDLKKTTGNVVISSTQKVNLSQCNVIFLTTSYASTSHDGLLTIHPCLTGAKLLKSSVIPFKNLSD